MTATHALRSFASAMTLAYACGLPPPDHTLPVRHLSEKCALVKFSGCAVLEAPAPQQAEVGDDAGPDSS